MRLINIVLALTLLFSLPGCSTSPKPTAEIGIWAYEGSSVIVEGGILGTNFGRKETNRVDTRDAAYRMTDRETIRAFVDESTIGHIDLGEHMHYDAAAILQELTEQTRRSVPKWGRFRLVKTKDKADIIIQSHLASIVPWNDSRNENSSITESYSPHRGAASGTSNHEREGVDILVSVDLSIAASDETIGGSSVVGRQVAHRGEIFREVSINPDRGGGIRGDSGAEGVTATVDERRLPQLFIETIDAAMISLFPAVDHVLWGPPDQESGMRTATVPTD